MNSPDQPGVEPPKSVFARITAWLRELAGRIWHGVVKFVLVEVLEHLAESSPEWAKSSLARLELACLAALGPSAFQASN